MAYKLRPAKRSESKVTGGIFGKSGCGKTYTLLLMARGIVGPEGKIAIADTEGGRGELLSDVAEIGGYEYLEIRPPYTAQAYLDAIETFEKEGVGCGVIDSTSHLWEGEGGTIEQARANEKRTGKAGIHNWNKPKQDLNRLVLKIMQTKVHLLFGLRAKRKSRQFEVVENGVRKTKIARDGFYSPKMDEDFISELLFCAEQLGIDDARGKIHSLIVHKITHPKIGEFFKDGIIPSKRTGELFRAWSKNSNFKVSDADAKPAATVVRQEAPIIEDRTEAPQGKVPPMPDEDEAPSHETWEPPTGWPEFAKVSEWLKWSRDIFLPTATNFHVRAWLYKWQHFYARVKELAEKKEAAAVKGLAELEPLIAAAYKRQPKKEPS
jgi:energy-coupling factor transporter ATP-binding protein EcfA2